MRKVFARQTRIKRRSSIPTLPFHANVARPFGQAKRELGCRGTAPAAVADAEEVLAALTRILRGEEEAKTSEVLRAAELLGKQYGLFGDREGAPTEAPKIVMDVPGRGEKK